MGGRGTKGGAGTPPGREQAGGTTGDTNAHYKGLAGRGARTPKHSQSPIVLAVFHLSSFSPNIWTNALNNMLVLRILLSVYCWKEHGQPEFFALQRRLLCFVWVLFAPVFELCAQWFRGYLIVLGFGIVGQRSTHWLIYFHCIMWLIVRGAHREYKAEMMQKITTIAPVSHSAAGELFVRELSVCFIIVLWTRQLLHRLPGCTFP